jgi:hypothetical protein
MATEPKQERGKRTIVKEIAVGFSSAVSRAFSFWALAPEVPVLTFSANCYAARSKMPAAPMPPPTHIVTKP